MIFVKSIHSTIWMENRTKDWSVCYCNVLVNLHNNFIFFFSCKYFLLQLTWFSFSLRLYIFSSFFFCVAHGRVD